MMMSGPRPLGAATLNLAIESEIGPGWTILLPVFFAHWFATFISAPLSGAFSCAGKKSQIVIVAPLASAALAFGDALPPASAIVAITPTTERDTNIFLRFM